MRLGRIAKAIDTVRPDGNAAGRVESDDIGAVPDEQKGTE